jgi:hypothetical protein
MKLKILKILLLIFFFSVIFFSLSFLYKSKDTIKDSPLLHNGDILSISNKDDDFKKDLIDKHIKMADSELTVKANPIKTIRVEGLLSSDPIYKKSTNSLNDIRYIYDLSSTYVLTGNNKYSDKATEILLAWASTNISHGNPIDDTQLEQSIYGYSWIRNNISEADRTKIDNWYKSIANKEINTPLGIDQEVNNWQSHRLMIVGLIGYTTQDQKLIDYAIEGFKKHIEVNLNNDGSSIDYTHRDSLWYHTYNLNALLALARAAKLNGVDLLNYEASNGASLKKSVEFALPYYKGDKVHNEFVKSNVKFDKTRSDAGQKDYITGSKFDPTRSLHTMELYYSFDVDTSLPLIQKFSGNDVYYPTFPTLIYSLTQRLNSGVKIY